MEQLDDAVYEAGYSLESIVLRNLKGEDTVAAGKNVIRDQIGDLTFEISPASFYQVNPVQTERLYDKVREYCGFSAKADAGDPSAMPEALQENGEKPVILDLYCGVGTIFTVPMKRNRS